MRNRLVRPALAILIALAPVNSLAGEPCAVAIVPYKQAQKEDQAVRKHDSRKNGLLIGAAVGAAIGILGVGMADCPGDNPSGPCKGFRISGFAISIGTGALIGFGIDSLMDQQNAQPGTPYGRSRAPASRPVGMRARIRW